METKKNLELKLVEEKRNQEHKKISEVNEAEAYEKIKSLKDIIVSCS